MNKPKTIQDVISNFRKEYCKYYQGILSDELVDKGNPWFENFIKTEFTSVLEGLRRKDVEKPDRPCMNYEMHLLGRCFDCTRNDGYNDRNQEINSTISTISTLLSTEDEGKEKV